MRLDLCVTAPDQADLVAARADAAEVLALCQLENKFLEGLCESDS